MWLRSHGEVIEADLQREYDVDLRGWWRGELTTRRLMALVWGLSANARLWAEVRAEQETDEAGPPVEPGNAPKDLRTIPVAKSLADVGAFIAGADLPKGGQSAD